MKYLPLVPIFEFPDLTNTLVGTKETLKEMMSGLGLPKEAFQIPATGVNAAILEGQHESIFGMKIIESPHMPSWMVTIGNPFKGGTTMIIWNDAYRKHLADKFKSKGWRVKVK